MEQLLKRAHSYLAGLEADRQAALTLSEQKAEEAKLIKARQEGFQAAMEILAGEISAGTSGSGPKEPGRRRGRRPIAQLILRELSFSGQAMTAAQIARAIGYIPERTETALERMEKAGQVFRNEEGRWEIGITTLSPMNGHAVKAGNGKSSTRRTRRSSNDSVDQASAFRHLDTALKAEVRLCQFCLYRGPLAAAGI